jgi:hypothetical protein
MCPESVILGAYRRRGPSQSRLGASPNPGSSDIGFSDCDRLSSFRLSMRSLAVTRYVCRLDLPWSMQRVSVVRVTIACSVVPKRSQAGKSGGSVTSLVSCSSTAPTAKIGNRWAFIPPKEYVLTSKYNRPTLDGAPDARG